MLGLGFMLEGDGPKWLEEEGARPGVLQPMV